MVFYAIEIKIWLFLGKNLSCFKFDKAKNIKKKTRMLSFLNQFFVFEEKNFVMCKLPLMSRKNVSFMGSYINPKGLIVDLYSISSIQPGPQIVNYNFLFVSQCIQRFF